MKNSSDFITTGGGKLYIQKKGENNLSYFGLTNEVALKVDTEFLEHENTEGAIKSVDKKIIKKRTATLSFSSDEISSDMLALAFLGTKNLNTTLSSAEYSDVELGAIIDTKAINANIELQSNSTTLEPGVDYNFNPKDGMLEIINVDKIVANKISATFTNVVEKTKISAFKNASVEAKLVFISNANVGKSYKYTFHKVSLSQSGDFNLKSDDWMSLSFEAEVLKDESQTKGSEFFEIEEIN